MKLHVASPLFLTFGLIACGGDDGGVTPVVDAQRIDAAGIDAPVVCTVSTASFGDRGALTPSLCIQDPGDDTASPMDDVIVLRAPLEAGSPFDELEIQLWSGFGALANGFAAGTYPITGDELQYATCGVCVFINSDRTDPDNYVDDYLATGGTVTLTSVVGSLTGTVANLTFEHVTIAQGESSPAGDGCVSALTGATFTETIEPPPMNKPGQAGASRTKGRVHRPR